MISARSSWQIFGPISRTRLTDWADQWRASSVVLSLAASVLLSSACSDLRGADPAIRPLSVAFEHDDLGKTPRGFSTGLTGGGSPVFWAVREVPNAPGGKPVLLQESSDATSFRFPVCVYDDFVARDVAVQVRFMAISGRVDQAGGIVLRYHPDNYYVARANALEDNINLYKIVGGKRTRIKEAPLKVTPGEWHTLRFTAKGPTLIVAFDGRELIETTDDSFTKPGQIGLWTKADSVSAFADLQIKSLRQEPRPRAR